MTPDSQVLLRPKASHVIRDRETARRLKREGRTVTQIAAELGRSRSTIGGWVRGVEATRPCKLCGTPFEVENTVRKYCSNQCLFKWHDVFGKAAA